jgi:nitroreductase
LTNKVLPIVTELHRTSPPLTGYRKINRDIISRTGKYIIYRGINMELRDAIEKRSSIRAYKEKPVPEEKLLKVLEAARLAPSGRNSQAWKFVVVRDNERRQAIWRATGGQPHVYMAPVIIAAVATDPDSVMPCGILAYPVDLAIAIDHITLAAVDLGLGTCWIGAFSQDKVKNILGVPEKLKVVSLLTLGYPDETGRPKMRKMLEEIVCYEKYEK